MVGNDDECTGGVVGEDNREKGEEVCLIFKYRTHLCSSSQGLMIRK